MSEKVKLDKLHLAIALDGKVHVGILGAPNPATGLQPLITGKSIHAEFLTCMVQRFCGKEATLITALDGTRYRIIVEKIGEKETDIVLPGDKSFKLPGGLKN